MLTEFSLTNRVAIVVGADQPIGKAIATALAEAGADVAVVASDAAAGEATAQGIRELGRRAAVFVAPAATPETTAAQVANALSQTVAEWGQVDIYVHAREAAHAKPFLEMDAVECRRVIDANLFETLLCCQVAGRHLVERGQGRIINLVSGLAERGIANTVAFSVAKAGVIELTRVLGTEWARSGVTVNAIGLGWFEEAGFSIEPLHHFIPMRRPGKAEDIGGLAVYLASDASAYLTGQSVFIDGGALCRG